MTQTRQNPYTGMTYTVAQSAHGYTDCEDECDYCDGDGRIWNNADPTSGQWVECDMCEVQS
jgi:hypothetical protein